MPPTPSTRRKNSTARKSSRTSKTTTPQPEVAATPEASTGRVSHGNRDGAIGTAAKPSPQAAEFLKVISGKRKAVTFSFKDSVQPELLLQANGWTLAYLVQREGATTIVARRPSSSRLNIKDIGGSVTMSQAADILLKFMDERGKGNATAAASKETSKTATKGNAKKDNGQKESLSNGLTAQARRTASAARAKPRARSRSRSRA